VLTQPSSLSQLAYRIGDTLSVSYGIDPLPLYEDFGIDPRGPKGAGERLPNKVLSAMLAKAAAEAGDPGFGVRVGLNSELRHFFVIGHAWSASGTLLEAFGKLLRYEAILNSERTELRLERRGDSWRLSEAYPDEACYGGRLRSDVGLASVVKMCRLTRGGPLYANRVEAYRVPATELGNYADLVQGPVTASDAHNALWFPAADLEAPLSGSIPELVEASSRIADRYLASLDGSRVANQVRAQLVTMLPGGAVDQDKVASRLFRSASTLQRQLQSEGTTYRDVLDATRRELAEAYLRDPGYSQAEAAFLVGFSDQSNFARAFKRWTGTSPGRFRRTA
jgi:AraC-like DNA-binding protein